jgi:uncharacterized repeat protein (TIGR02543 family)
VTYNANSSTSGTVPPVQHFVGGTSATLATNVGTLAKTGYTFNGWNTNAAGTGTHYNAGAAWASIPAGNHTLYAEWTPDYIIITYWANITYNGNGNTGGTVPAVQHFAAGGNATLAANSGTLARTGYTFNGWNSNAAGTGTHYAASGTWASIPAGNHTLYAEWTPDYIVITYWANVT